MTIGKFLGALLIGLAFFLAATSRSHTPPFKNADGGVIETSIAEERRISLGGAEQYVLIRGVDRSAPLLIFLHGGPGYSAMPFNRLRNADLEQNFVFVNWDQRGAGYSLSAAKDRTTLTLDQLARDLDELIDILRAEFGQEKVLLIGHSWGSLLGLEYVSRHPEKAAAYIGVSQMADTAASERDVYDWALRQAQMRNDDKTVQSLEKNGGPPYDSPAKMMAHRRAANKLGGVWYEPKPDWYFAREYLRAEEFAWPGYWSLVRAGALSLEILFETFSALDAAETYPQLNAPVFFIEGRHDHVVSPKAAEEYLSVLEAPYKEMIWFERSGHMPNWEEPERFNSEVLRIAKQVGLLE